jgi:hypothetical protein
VLLHRIRNTTQLVSGLNALLSLEPEGSAPALPAGRADDLAAAAREADELGWLLGVLAGGLGADLLLQRCERRGLATALDLVREAVRRDGGELALPDELPDMTPEVPSHGELCWIASELVWSTATAGGLRVELTEEGGTWRLHMGGPAPGRRARVVRRLPGAELDGGGGAWTLTLPGPWLA